MIKIFYRNGAVNFVDDCNKLVGFNYESQCCEDYGWNIKTSDGTVVLDSEKDGYDSACDEAQDCFKNGASHKVWNYKFSGKCEVVEGGYYDMGGVVRFELVSNTEPTLWLYVWNRHNGFYSHGLEFMDGDKQICANEL